MGTDAPWVLAIDIGTTFSVAAARRAAGVAEVIEVDGQRRVPSVVVLDEDGTVVVGQAAENLAAANPARAVRAPKSRIGDPAPIVIGGRLANSTDLVAALIRHLYDAAVRHCGSAPTEVRLTHPAIWGRPRIEQLVVAAEAAQLTRVVLLPEPVAAAVAYAEQVELPSEGFIAVYDLGGGTFDTAVLQATRQGFTVIGRPAGEDRLGGELFDELLANHVGRQLEPAVWESLQLSDDLRWQQAAAALRAESRRVKEALSSHPHAELLLGLPDGMVQQRVTAVELEGLMQPYIDQSIDRLAQVIHDAGLLPEQLSAICLTGGASHAPLVERAVQAAFPGVAVGRRGDPKTAVACGATHPRSVGSTGAQAPGTLRPVGTDPARAHSTPAAVLEGADPATPATPRHASGLITADGSLPLAGTPTPPAVAATWRAPAAGFPAAGSPQRIPAAGSPVTANGQPTFPPAPVPSLVDRKGGARRSWRLPVSLAAALILVVAVVAVLASRRDGTGKAAIDTANATGPAPAADARRSPVRAGTTTSSSTAPAAPAALAADSPLEQFLGSEIRRQWSVASDQGSVLVSVAVTNTATGTFRWHHDEIVPKALAAEAAAVDTNPPAEIIQADPMVRWWHELAPGETATFIYRVVRQPSWPKVLVAADLTAWELDRATLTAVRQEEILTANQLGDRHAAPVPVVAPHAAAGTAPPPSTAVTGPGVAATTPPVVVVTPAPTAAPQTIAPPTVTITGSSQLCAGQRSYLEGVATGAVSGAWTISSFSIANAAWSPGAPRQLVEPDRGAIGGTFRATLQVLNAANVAATASFDFRVVDCTPTPTVLIDGPSTICAEQQSTFTGVVTGATSGTWSLPAFNVSNALWSPAAPSQFVNPNAGAGVPPSPGPSPWSGRRAPRPPHSTASP